MNTTKKLFYVDPYQKEFEAKVLEVADNKVVLDQTCFYPEGGGQAGDIGEINGARIMDTIKEGAEMIEVGDQRIPAGGTIYHILESMPDFSVGDIVKATIDWDRRYRTMRLHSAGHIMEHFLYQVFGEMKRFGSKVDHKKDRGDYETQDKLDPEKLSKVQELCNDFISKNHDIKTWPSEENENIRVWRCADIEMYCGGTHVRNTEEIGKIRLKRDSKGACKERVETYLD